MLIILLVLKKKTEEDIEFEKLSNHLFSMSVEARRALVIKEFAPHPTKEDIMESEELREQTEEYFKKVVYETNMFIEESRRKFDENAYLKEHQRQIKRDDNRGNRGGTSKSGYGIDKNRQRNDRGKGGSRGNRFDKKGNKH